jgi:hypothetical protein
MTNPGHACAHLDRQNRLERGAPLQHAPNIATLRVAKFGEWNWKYVVE